MHMQGFPLDKFFVTIWNYCVLVECKSSHFDEFYMHIFFLDNFPCPKAAMTSFFNKALYQRKNVSIFVVHTSKG